MTLEDIATLLLQEISEALNADSFVADVNRHELHPGNPELKRKVAMTRQYCAGLYRAYQLCEEALDEQE